LLFNCCRLSIFFWPLLSVVWLLPTAAGQDGFASPSPLVAGLASVDITPSQPIRLSGFGNRTRESQGVRQPLFTKALAIGSSDDDTVMIITVDTLGIPADMTQRVAAVLADRLRLPRERLAICATHTHSAPMILNCANTLFGKPIPEEEWKRILEYTGWLEDSLVQAAEAAWKDRRPAKLAWGIGQLGFAFNRRTAGGPVDHDLPVLAIQAPDGTLRGVFANYACHCVTLSDDLMSGDWAGYAMEHLQRLHPGCQTAVSIGCGADSNPRGGVLGDRAEVASSLGLEFAEAVDRVLKSELQPISEPPRAVLEFFPLKLAPVPSLDEWRKRAQQQNAVGYHAQVHLQRLECGEMLKHQVDYSVQTIAFGRSLAMVFLPGEVVVDYSLRLKQELDSERLWVNAYTNDCPGYVPSERILREGGYEGGGAMVYYDIPGPYAAGLEDTIVAAVHRQLDGIIPRADAAAIDSSRTNGIAPLTPRQSLRSLRISPGFRVELAAAEPLLQSPSAIAFGPDQRVWISEMSDYPQGDPERPGLPGGRIRCLMDSNGDGRLDQSAVFLESIPFPTGVTVWRDGLLICAAPDILFARDSDGDLRADHVEKLFTGFATHNFQARVNSLEYGLDGWVYGSCGIFGGEILSVKTGKVTALGQRDFRCHPDTGAFEAVSGNTQQGRVRNDEGDWFGCNNSVPLMHYPLEEQNLRRNPFTAVPQTSVSLAAVPNPGRLYPISSQVLFALSGPPNSFTAACGPGLWRDDIAGMDFRGNAFTCEPVNNLVHRQQLIPSGSTFTSRRASGEESQEFLASTDPWFRPVQARTGLDGALWVVDMYRYVIEHPIWIPPAVLKDLDTRAGHDRGRLYRVLPNAHSGRTPPNLAMLSGPDLADAINSPNGTQRDLVQQLILWNTDLAARPRLLELISIAERPEVRLQAAATADLLEPLPEELLLRLLQDPGASVRRHAVRLAQPRLKQSPVLADEVVNAARDSDPFVRMAAAAAAADLTPQLAAPILAEILASPESDRFLQTTADSSLTADNVAAVFSMLPENASAETRRRLLKRVAQMGSPETAMDLLRKLTTGIADQPSSESFRALAQLLHGWSHRSTALPANSMLENALSAGAEAAGDDRADAEIRSAAAELLGAATGAGLDQSARLLSLLQPRTPVPVQLAAVSALSQCRRAELAGEILEQWPALSPDIRRRLTALLLERPEWTGALLESLAAGVFSSSELDLTQRRQLLEHPRESIRTAAEKLLNSGTGLTANRQELIDRYAAALDASRTAAVDPAEQTAAGLAVFRKHCSNCHRLQGTGHAVGPDLANYAAKSPLALVTAVFDPNQAVDPRYQAYAVILQDGRNLSGLIASESDNSLTLLAPEGRETVLLRSEIEALRSTGKSLMPENLEQAVSTQDLQLLWRWIRTQRQPPKSLPGNTPQVVSIAAAGNIVLNASAAEISGGEITFEIPFQNIGYWHGADDHVRWKLSARASRRVDLWVEWACHPDSAGNAFLLEIAGQTLKGTVDSSGGWDRYQLQSLGSLLIPEGDAELVLRPAGPLRGALADLRALHLVSDGSVPLVQGMTPVPPAPEAGATPAEVVAWLLNDAVPDAEREAFVGRELTVPTRRSPATIIRAMAESLPNVSGSAEEYRRIPWIWRVAIQVGKGGPSDAFTAVFRDSLPREGQKLQHWQAVVLGGGLINGLTLSGHWPHDVIAGILRSYPKLSPLWNSALRGGREMAADNSVPTGTRYDALRMMALLPWQEVGSLFVPYLAADAHPELQMGAVSGLGDIPEDAAAIALIDAFQGLTAANKLIALEALQRTPARQQMASKAGLPLPTVP
jgi:putative membrane-bound dehydrogenase-like protein